MKRKNNISCALLVVFALAVMSGGCGGGSDSDIDFYSLSGKWNPHNGAGTASGGGFDFRVQLSDPPGSTEFDVLNLTEEDVAIAIDSAIKWDIYYQGVYTDIATDQLGLGKQKIVVQRVGEDSFQFTGVDGKTLKVKITSDTTLEVEESGGYTDPEVGTFIYSVKYLMTKEGSDSGDQTD